MNYFLRDHAQADCPIPPQLEGGSRGQKSWAILSIRFKASYNVIGIQDSIGALAMGI